VASLINYYGWSNNIFFFKISTIIERERKKRKMKKGS